MKQILNKYAKLQESVKIAPYNFLLDTFTANKKKYPNILINCFPLWTSTKT